mmetsp:Transcript_46131/g.124383  ORF Transcript_46131/g.124383 Transcript_46131/m.124383 type:complete len:323 (+) Transcript_46131:50-1018(+)
MRNGSARGWGRGSPRRCLGLGAGHPRGGASSDRERRGGGQGTHAAVPKSPFEYSPTSPNFPFPLATLLYVSPAAHVGHAQSGNLLWMSWQVLPHQSSSQSVQAWDSHIRTLNRSCPVQSAPPSSNNATKHVPTRDTAFIADAAGRMPARLRGRGGAGRSGAEPACRRARSLVHDGACGAGAARPRRHAAAGRDLGLLLADRFLAALAVRERGVELRLVQDLPGLVDAELVLLLLGEGDDGVSAHVLVWSLGADAVEDVPGGQATLAAEAGGHRQRQHRCGKQHCQGARPAHGCGSRKGGLSLSLSWTVPRGAAGGGLGTRGS